MSETLFECGAEYDAMLNEGLRLSGENKSYFAAGRVRDLHCQLPADFAPKRVLDFGCGIGDSTLLLAQSFPGAWIVGVDTAEKALAHARAAHGNARISFATVAAMPGLGKFDLCYVNGVFHHIAPADRAGAATAIRNALAPGGYLALFENNPWNPGTRMIMSRIPFDRDAQMITPREARRLLVSAGFTAARPARSLFFYPRILSWLRFSEPWLARTPLGAQYYLLAQK